VLQVADAAVHDFQGVRRCRCPEISALDQGDGKATLCGIPGDRSAADPSAYHHHIEFPARQCRQVSLHGVSSIAQLVTQSGVDAA
jgi:hypothetical protein